MNIERRGSWGLAALAGPALAVLAGCGSGGGKDTASVAGTVTYQGQPVTGGSVTFSPIAASAGSEAGKPAAGTVQPDGTFELGTYSESDGAVVGRHRVSYAAPLVELPPGQELKPGQSLPPSPYDGLVPQEAEVEVQSGGNEITIVLVPASGSRGS